MSASKIVIETSVLGSVEDVWRAWTTPEDIKQWNAASDDWHTTAARVDLRVGGEFSSRMEAKDGSMGFDFEGIYTRVEPMSLIESKLGDDRRVLVEFIVDGNRVVIRESFDAEPSQPMEMQRAGWQAILDNFARHVQEI